MNKKAFLLASMSTLAATAACFSILTATISWFRTFENQEISGGGSTFNSYFAGGDGSEADPYQISNSTQMYNFAWLQYMGVFNKDTDNNGVIDQQYYFVVNNDIDMSGMVIPPIGTVKNPFLGNFNGNDYVISNLTVSNEIDTTQVTDDKIYYHPDGVTNLEGETELGLYGAVRIVGFFGVIGTARQLGYNLSYTYDTDVAKAFSFYLDKEIIYSKSSTTLVGLVAGYIGAPTPEDDDEKITIIHDIGVYQSKVGVVSNATGLSTTYGTTVSKFSLVGDYSDNTIEWKTGESGDLDEFGGSIDMMTFNRRINYITTSSETFSTGSGAAYTASDSDFHTNLYYSNSAYIRSNRSHFDKTFFYWKMTGVPLTSIAYLQDGTYLPINVDTTAMGLDVDTENDKSITINGKTSSNKTNAQYDATGATEIIKNTNTGYIIGSGSGSSSGIRARINAAGVLYRSLNLNNVTTGMDKQTIPAETEIAPRFQMLTTKNGTTWNRISDEQNANATTDNSISGYAAQTYQDLGLERYGQVKDDFSNKLKKTGLVNGIGPQSYLPNSNLSDSNILTVNNGTIGINDGVGDFNKANYQFVKGAVNFTLKRSGFLSSVLGAYTTSLANQSAFDLFRITRDANGNINLNSYTKVTEVYYNSNTQIPSFTAGTGYTKVYDNTWFSTLPVAYVAYYLEIPLPAGDYVLGCSTNVQYGAYPMYLDIGANGGGTEPVSDFKFDIDNVKFIATKNIIDDYENVLFLLSFAAATHGEGSIFFKHNGLTPAEEITISYTVMTVTPNTTITVTENASAQTWNNTL